MKVDYIVVRGLVKTWHTDPLLASGILIHKSWRKNWEFPELYRFLTMLEPRVVPF